MEGLSSPTIAPLLLRNLLTSIFIHTHKTLIYLSEKNELFQLVRYFLTSSFLFFLRLLPSLFPSLESPNYPPNFNKSQIYPSAAAAAGAGSGVARSLSQLLQIMNDIPVSSRKYDVVRSLIETLINENLKEGDSNLRDVNCAVLSAAFDRSLNRLEAVMVGQGRGGHVACGAHGGDDYCYGYGSSSSSRVRSLVRGVRYCGGVMWQYAMKARGDGARWGDGDGSGAEKLAAEVLWVARKMRECGCGDEAAVRWAEARSLGWVGLGAEPRLQGNLVKVSAFLIKQVKEMGEKEARTTGPSDHTRQIKMKMLMSWLPLLCRASNGTDAPILSMMERAELESIVEEMIGTLEEAEQEQVLSLWLHHFTYCSTSDWPNLRTCYTQWFDAARRTLLLPAAPAVASIKYKE